MAVTVMVAENVLVTDPEPVLGAKAARTSWKDVLNCEVKVPDHRLSPSEESPLKPKLTDEVVAVRLMKLKGEAKAKAGGPGVQTWPPAAGNAHDAEPKTPGLMKLMFSDCSRGAELNEINKWSANPGAPTISGGLARFWIVTSVPPSVLNEPVAPVSITASFGVNGGVARAQVMVFAVAVIWPVRSKVPKMGDADKVAVDNPASSAPHNNSLLLIPRIP